MQAARAACVRQVQLVSSSACVRQVQIVYVKQTKYKRYAIQLSSEQEQKIPPTLVNESLISMILCTFED